MNKQLTVSTFFAKFLRYLAKKYNLSQRGFTLVEMLIVVIIFGLLASVALSHFITARSRSQASTKVGELIGLSRECSTDMASQLQSVMNYAGAAYICGSTLSVTLSATFPSGADGVICLSDIAENNDTQIAVTIATSGAVTCRFD